MQNKIVVIGLGNVGISYIYALINSKFNVKEIAIIDLNEEKVKGEVMDFNHALPFLNLDVNIHLGTYDDCQNAQIIVICAGAKQEIGQTRLDLLNENTRIIKNIITNIVKHNFQGILINTTNPLDVISLEIYKQSNIPASKIIGSGTFLDTARLKYFIHKKLNVPYASIDAYVIGEHGDSAVIPWNSIFVNETKITELLSKEELKDLENKVHNAGYELLNSKGFSSSAIGNCLVSITDAILNDKKQEIIISTYDNLTNTYYGYPVLLGQTGVIKKQNLLLTKTEQELLDKSIAVIWEAYKKIS